MPQTQIGYLVPLKEEVEGEGEGEEEDSSIPKLAIFEGPNVIGRNNIPCPDRRLSRKHLTLTTSSDASTILTVEGTNPIVIKSGNERKKLYSGENLIIRDGDVLELIPGHHFFKYITSPCHRDVPLFDTQGRHSNEADGQIRKKMRQECDDKAEITNYSKAEAKNGRRQKSEEAIRHFHVPKDKLPLTFRLLRVQGLPEWANTSSVSIMDVIQGDIVFAVLSNYMVDIDWLIPACPILTKIPHVLVIHGEGDGALDHMKRKKPANWILHKPPLPISFGTHHSKAMLLVYSKGVRIIIHTANLINVDWNNKSQGLWMQDFPWKDQNKPGKGCAFETDLIDYLSALKWPEFTANFPSLGNININSSFFKKFDYSNATVRLIASVPGYHTGSNLKKWGHMKLRTILQECTFDKEFQNSPLVYQFSSLGSLDEKWMTELASSMSSGFSEDKMPLGLGEPLIIWPTVEDVRCSLEGYAAGSAIPSPQKNVEREFLKKYWAKWKAIHTGRCRAMPHIKTYTRYNGQKLAWFLLTSANLSKAAWGALQKNNSQLMIRSYELGVLFLPYPTRRHGYGFSCTDNGGPSLDKFESTENSKAAMGKLVTLTSQGSRNTDLSDVIPLPVPYELPPQQYSSEDVPWSWDRRYGKKDVYGQVWPRKVQLYAIQDS
ncbi:Tyr-DNA_phospho domain-containing protein [Cephalotus follicularis]|uniref:Tyr-DNA_phospho domain-containing protein n=1 Tax=Cephalotus follicularis TaxID=3775 RepID=A0A1Q3C073_CEPFO|nr:Tyr-DNA_phospho domain-containing protein [Cephalotus follicularis]